MFGFGISDKDKWHLGQAEAMLASVAEIMGQDTKVFARQIFDTTRSEMVAR